MLKLMRYFKRVWLPILAVIILLFVQAYCDLSLPTYTSGIVNVGIQQEGIEHAAPLAITQNHLEAYLLLMDEADAALVQANYTLLAEEMMIAAEWQRALSNYPALKEEAVYERRAAPEDMGMLDLAFSRVFAAIGMLQGGAGVMDGLGDTPEGLPMGMDITALQSMVPEGTDPFELLKRLPEAVRGQLVAGIRTLSETLPESLLSQSAIAQTRKEHVDVGMNPGSMQTRYILITGAKMLALALLSLAAAVACGFFSSRIAARIGRDVRGDVFKKVVSFSSAEMDKFSTASLITRSTNDVQQVQMVMVMLLRIIFYAPIMGVGGILKVLNTNTGMAWIIAVAVAALLMLIAVLFSVAMPRFKLMQKLVDRLNLVMREILSGLQVIRAFSTQRHEEKRFDGANRDLMKNQLFVNRAMAFMMPVMTLIMNGTMLLIMWNGAYSVDAGAMQVGDMMAFIQYTMQIIMAFLMISMLSIMLPRASVSAVRIDEVLRTESAIHDPESPKSFDEAKRGVVEFDHVSFGYPGAEADVLTDITFTAMPGQTTAIIGSTGSGKSTLLNLIPRFYDVTGGSLKVGGTDVRDVDQKALRARMGLVPQKGVLFSGTIASNIAYGLEAEDAHVMDRAAEVAQAADFIRERPDGLASEIAQGGGNVSGGQKQRLSIARAIAVKPDIFLFDDSFSALDYRTDVMLRNALREHTGSSTVIIVAQRVSTILSADQIIVLDEGKIAGKGTHAELMRTCEVYQQIASSQLSKEELAV